MLNALIYRPAEGHAEEALINVSCQHLPVQAEEDDSAEEGEPEPILYNRGLYFISDLNNDRNCYRLPAVRNVEVAILATLYRRQDLNAIKNEFNIMYEGMGKNAAHKTRIHNRRPKTLDIRYAIRLEEEEPDVDAEPPFDLAEQGVRVRPEHRMAGPDVRRRGGPEAEEGENDPDQIVANIFRQLPSDIFQKAPNRKLRTKPGYTLLSADEQTTVKVDIFRSLDFTRIFDKIQYRVVDESTWKLVLFPRYFPARGQLPPDQNFRGALYYKNWVKLINRLDGAGVELIRDTLWDRFAQFLWLPHGGSDRMWATKVMKAKDWVMLPAEPREPCPQIAINGTLFRGQRITMGQRVVVAIREEEEEEEEGSGE
jgi:hypothetical protein